MRRRRWVAGAALVVVWVLGVGVDRAYGQTAAQWLERANAALAAGRPDEAVGLYSKVIELDSRDTGALAGRAFARENMKDPDHDGALADVTAYLALVPGDADALLFRCKVRIGRGALDAALADCSRSLELQPRDPEAYVTRGVARSFRKDSKGAIEDYTKAIDLDPRSVRAFDNRGIEKERSGDLAGALADYQQACSLDGSDTQAKENRDRLMSRAGPSGPRPIPVAGGTKTNTTGPGMPPPLPPPPPLPGPPPLPLPPDAAAGQASPATPPIPAERAKQAPLLIKHVDPEYPPVAVTARIHGVVILDATIEPDGTVSKVTVVRSIPLLDQAAIDAVRQWVYEPTKQKGALITTVTVTFSLK